MRTHNGDVSAKQHRPRAFTQIELVVVMSLIAFALALAAPGILETRETARRRQCWNNLHQYGLITYELGPRGAEYLPDIQHADPKTDDAEDSAVRRFFSAVFATFAMIPMIVAALFVRWIVKSINSHDEGPGRWRPDADGSSSILDCWFCPPSSSPV